MKAAARIRGTVCAALFTISGMSGALPALAAQTHEPIRPEFEPDFYRPIMLDTPIEVSGETYHIEDVTFQLYTEGENEQIIFVGDVGQEPGTAPVVVDVAFFDDEDTPDRTIELWVDWLAEGMESLDIVDSGLDGDVIWYYVVAEANGLTQLYYVQIQQDVEGNIDVLESVLTIDGAMLDALEIAQNEIAVGGEPFMDDVEPEEMQQLLAGEPFRQGDDD